MDRFREREYYAACPQCGASNDGVIDHCEFCGANLIKFERVDVSEMDPEKAREIEDSQYEVIPAKSCNTKAISSIFGIVFGAVFIGGATSICQGFIAMGAMEKWLWGFFGIFWLVGGTAIVMVLVGFYARVRCSLSSEQISAEVRGYSKSEAEINGQSIQEVRLKIYENGSYKILYLNIGSTQKLYPVGSTVKLKRYKKNFKIV